jgi:bifunctional non-homologous end joining protein LigD
MKDSLAEYNRKRDFKQTSEPEGDIEGAVTSPRLQNFRFVIQKHHASQLHYDFRIEHEGVLKSWAVPKGPPYKSSERHLAMAVEDHPLDYYDFEGVIPEGNYGAGNVIVWDMGNYWVPHAENADDVTEKLKNGFEKGEIKLILNGEKVKGMFALVRFKRAGENA